MTSLTFDNVEGIDTQAEVNEWIGTLKDSSKLDITKQLYLELNEFEWKNLESETLLDMSKLDLNIGSGNILVKGNGLYGMLTRSEYIDITKKYGVDAFVDSSNEKVFKDLKLTKKFNALQEYEYRFILRNPAGKIAILYNTLPESENYTLDQIITSPMKEKSAIIYLYTVKGEQHGSDDGPNEAN